MATKILFLFVFLILSIACLNDGGSPLTAILPTVTTAPKLAVDTLLPKHYSETPPPKPKVNLTEPPVIETRLIFPNGTIEKNGTYFIGDFKQTFTFRVEPKNARIYLNDSEINVEDGEFVISVTRGGEYLLKVDDKVFKLFIGHDAIKAEVVPRVMSSKVKIFFEDGSLAVNRTIMIFKEYSTYSGIQRRGPYEIISDEESMVPYWCGLTGEDALVRYIDKETDKLLLSCESIEDNQHG